MTELVRKVENYTITVFVICAKSKEVVVAEETLANRHTDMEMVP
jgi:hypothetical protein